MCSNRWLNVTYYVECICFGVAVFLNTILLILIREKPRLAFGKYKYLMMVFSILEILYAIMYFWCKPNAHVTQTSFTIFTILENSHVSKDIGVIAVTIWCSFYAMMLSLLSIHFFYRYTSVTAPILLMKRFSCRYIFKYTLYILTFSSIWGLSCYFLCGPTENKDYELKLEFEEAYCLEPDEYSYVGPQYFYEHRKIIDSNEEIREKIFHLPSFLGIGIIAVLMVGILVSSALFGAETYKILNAQGLACYAAKELQKQLFKTLVIQSSIPMIFMVLPITCMFLLPFFGVKVGEVANLIPMCAAIYPCLNPMIAMIFIKDFSNRIIEIITCSKGRRFKVGTLPASSADNTNTFNMQNLSRLSLTS